MHLPCLNAGTGTSHVRVQALCSAVAAGQERPLRDWPEFAGDRQRSFIFYDDIVSPWWDNAGDSQRWRQPWSDAQYSGMRKSAAYCADIKNQVSACEVIDTA